MANYKWIPEKCKTRQGVRWALFSPTGRMLFFNQTLADVAKLQRIVRVQNVTVRYW